MVRPVPPCAGSTTSTCWWSERGSGYSETRWWRAREFRWAPALYTALEGTRDRFCGPWAGESEAWLPAGVLEALSEASDLQASRLVARRADSLQTRATGVVAAASLLSSRARLRLLLAIAIPCPAYMRWRYKPSPAWLWPLCYPYRWHDILREGLSTLWRIADSRWLMADSPSAISPSAISQSRADCD